MSNTLLDIFKNGSLKDSGILDHLCELIRAQLNNKNELKTLSQIEVLSYFLRTNSFKFKQLLDDHRLKQKIYADKQYAEYIEKLKTLNQNLQRVQNGKSYAVNNINTQYQALKTAGICIGQNNYYYIAKAMRLLAIKNNVKNIKFWGKILGRKDYYVIQGLSSNPYLNQLGKDSQPYGIGVNGYSYWVANDILGDWTQLPLVTPSQVKSSRDFKYIFSGQLDSLVQSFVPFKGKQKHLLKCVIARITHACSLTPKGLYKSVQGDYNSLDFEQSEEGYKLPEVNQLATLQAWAHLPANILSHGRTTHYIDSSLPEQQKQALKAQLQQKQPLGERLKPITDDKPYDYNGYTAASNWVAQLCGETIPVSLIGKQQGQSATYGVALLRNLSWPGSATVGFRGGWTSVYIGYGHRANQELKIIKQMADIQLQGNDIQQKHQPNPSNPPPAQKPAQQAPQAPQE